MALTMDDQRVLMTGVILSNGDGEVVVSESGQTVRFRFELDDGVSGSGEPEDISILLPAGKEEGSITFGFCLGRDHDKVTVNCNIEWILPTMRRITYTVYEWQFPTQ